MAKRIWGSPQNVRGGSKERFLEHSVGLRAEGTSSNVICSSSVHCNITNSFLATWQVWWFVGHWKVVKPRSCQLRSGGEALVQVGAPPGLSG
jgi:hypothetical protein